MTPRTCARSWWALQETLGIGHGPMCCHKKSAGCQTHGEQALPTSQPVWGYPQRVEFGTAALGFSTYNNLKDYQCSLTASMGSKRSLFFFISLQVGLMKVKAYSRLGFFLNSALHGRQSCRCVHSLGRKSRKQCQTEHSDCQEC